MNHIATAMDGALLCETRTLAHVLLDIAQAGPLVWDNPNPKWARLSHDERGEALDRLDELQAEARTMIEAATGVSWDQISEACL